MLCGSTNDSMNTRFCGLSSGHAFSHAYLCTTRQREYPTAHHQVTDTMDSVASPLNIRLAGSGVPPEKLKVIAPPHRSAHISISRNCHRTTPLSTGKSKNVGKLSATSNAKAASPVNPKNKNRKIKEAEKYTQRNPEESSSDSSDENSLKASSTDSLQLKRFVNFVNDTVSETVQKSVNNSIRSFFEDTTKKIESLSVQILSNECLLSKMYLDIIDKFAKQHPQYIQQIKEAHLPEKHRNANLYRNDRSEESQEYDGDEDVTEESNGLVVSEKAEAIQAVQYNDIPDDYEDEVFEPSSDPNYRTHQRKNTSASLRNQRLISSRSSSDIDIKEVPVERLKMRKSNVLSTISPPPSPPPAPPLPTTLMSTKRLEFLHSKSKRPKCAAATETLQKANSRVCGKCRGYRVTEKHTRRSDMPTKACRCHCYDESRSPSPPSVQDRVRLFDSLKNGAATLKSSSGRRAGTNPLLKRSKRI